ncbi:hypothetical protein Ciccas_009789 [Cichlidogyrus casuarinus]|uniref:N-acetyltransferase domain-containing protein n=1 Tax=Cichlidogyrus casuarinus TaxID=1844966 RepID=A0ABD2PW90_9PLAT
MVRKCEPHLFTNFYRVMRQFFWLDLKSLPMISFTALSSLIVGLSRKAISDMFASCVLVIALRYIGAQYAMYRVLKLEKDFHNAMYWMEDQEKRVLLVAYDETDGEEQRKLVGFVGLCRFEEGVLKRCHFEADQGEESCTKLEEIGEFKRFFVFDAYQRGGIGLCILNHTEELAKERFGFKRLYFFSSTPLQSGLRFYQKHGYQILDHPRIKIKPMIPSIFAINYFYLVLIKKHLST